MGIRGLILAVAVVTGLFGQTGKRAYLSRCVGCHGEDGSGGGHGPGILNVRVPRATTRAAVADVIRNGIPAAGMPAFPLAAAELEAIADFVWTLKGGAGWGWRGGGG